MPADEAFQEILEGGFADAPPQLQAFASVARALAPGAPLPGPSADFKAGLRARLAYEASMSEEELFAAALDGRTEAADEMAPLLVLAGALAPAELPAPSPAFRYQLRNSLVAQAAAPTSLIERALARLSGPRVRTGRARRAVASVAMMALLALGSGSALAASSEALPVDALYGLKRLREGARLATSTGAERGERLLSYARIRLGEVRGMTERGVGDSDPYVDTLNLMDEHTLQGTRVLIETFRTDGHPALLRKVETFARVQGEDLSALIDRLPGHARLVARDSLSTIEQVEQRVQDVLNGCPCPADVLVGGDPTEGSSDAPVACDCPQPTGSGSNDPGTAPSDDGDDDAPTGDDDEPASDPTPPPSDEDEDPDAVDLPDLPGDTDDGAEDAIDDLIDDVLSSPSPLPLP